MHIIYLAGNSLNNKTWIEEVKSKFDSFSEGEILYYDHWQTGEKWINLEKESEKLKELVKDKTDNFIFAKSMGSILALKNIFEGKLNPKKMVICGLPYRTGKEEFKEIDECLKTLRVPTTFIQNEFDPVYSFDELTEILRKNPPIDYQLVNNPNNNTHDYEDFNQLTETTSIFLLARNI